MPEDFYTATFYRYGTSLYNWQSTDDQRPTSHFKNFELRYLSDSIHFCLVVWFLGTAGPLLSKRLASLRGLGISDCGNFRFSSQPLTSFQIAMNCVSHLTETRSSKKLRSSNTKNAFPGARQRHLLVLKHSGKLFNDWEHLYSKPALMGIDVLARHDRLPFLHCVSKNDLTLKRYSSKLYGSILMIFGRNI